MNRFRARDARSQSTLVNGFAFCLTLPYVWIENSAQAEIAIYSLGLVGHVVLYLAYCFSSHERVRRAVFLSSQFFTMSTTLLFFSIRAPMSLFLVCWVFGVLGLWANSVQFHDSLYRTGVLVWLGISFCVSTVFAWRTGQFFYLLSNSVVCIATYPVSKLLLSKKRDLERRIASFEQEISAIAFANSLVSHDIRNDIGVMQMGTSLPSVGDQPDPKRVSGLLERRFRRILDTLELLSFNAPTCFKVCPALTTLASQKLTKSFEIDAKLNDWTIEFNFYFFCRIIENVLQNSIEAHARRGLAEPVFVRFYADDDRLCIHDNCGGLGIASEDIGRVSEKDHKPDHFTRVLIDHAEKMNYMVGFDTVDGGCRVSIAFPRR